MHAVQRIYRADIVTEFEPSMKISLPTSKYQKVLLFFLPFLLSTAGILILWYIQDSEKAVKLLLLMFAYFFPPLGKESIIPIGIAGGEFQIPLTNTIITTTPINPFIMGIAIAFVDIMVGLFLLWNYDLAKKIPLIGKAMTKVENIGKGSSDKYAWIRPFKFIGIVLFIMIPFQGSGGFFGTMVGRLIGMKPLNVWYAIIIGSVTSCLLFAYFSHAVGSILQSNWMLGVFIIVLVAIIAVTIFAYQKNTNGKKTKKQL